MQVNLRDEVYERGKAMMTYGDSWSDLVERLINFYDEHKETEV